MGKVYMLELATYGAIADCEKEVRRNINISRERDSILIVRNRDQLNSVDAVKLMVANMDFTKEELMDLYTSVKDTILKRLEKLIREEVLDEIEEKERRTLNYIYYGAEDPVKERPEHNWEGREDTTAYGFDITASGDPNEPPF